MFLEVPKDAYGVLIRQNSEQSDLWYKLDIPEENSSYCIEIPHGNWQLLGSSPGLTEEQLKEIMPSYYGGTKFHNYNGNMMLDTAVEAYTSLKISKGVVDVNPLGEKFIPVGSDSVGDYHYQKRLYQQWHEAKQQVKSFQVLFKKD